MPIREVDGTEGQPMSVAPVDFIGVDVARVHNSGKVLFCISFADGEELGAIGFGYQEMLGLRECIDIIMKQCPEGF